MFNLENNIIREMELLVAGFVPQLDYNVRYMCACSGCDGCNPCTGGV